MNNLSNSTGLQNPIFKLIQNPQNFQSNIPNPNLINRNSLNPAQIGMNQFPGQININNPQQQPIMNTGINQINPQFFGNNGMMMNNISMQQMMLQQQMIQQQMIAAMEANKKAQINQIINNMVQGTGINSQVNQQSQPGITVNFRVSGMGKQDSDPIMIQCMPDEKVSAIIERYRAKTGDWDQTKIFTFNAKNLVPNLTLAESGIMDNAVIFVISKDGVIGGF